MKKIIIPNFVKCILAILHQHHAEAFLVGGCVRDMLMERSIHDYDITSSALPHDMITWFQEAGYSVIPTGLRHGTITVIVNHEAIEITTYRTESHYQNHRSPTQIAFTTHLEDDLQRRDFTMNAIAYDPTEGIIDPYQGVQDITLGLIRCVGTPSQRFEEDALRILRALRFASELHFHIEKNTWQAIQQHAFDLHYISKERIRDEINRLLLGEKENTLLFLRKAKVLEIIFPELCSLYDHPQKTDWHIYDIFKHTDVALNHTKGYPLSGKLAILFHDIGKPRCETYDAQGIVHFKGHAAISTTMAEQILQRYHYDNAMIQKVCTLIQYHDYYIHPKRSILRRYLAKFHNDLTFAFEALDVQIADNHAKNPERSTSLIENIETCKNMMLHMQQENDLISMKDVCINGHDLIALGLKGKAIGETLQKAYDIVLEDPQKNNKDILLPLLLPHIKS